MIKLLLFLSMWGASAQAATVDFSQLSPESKARAENLIPQGKDADISPVDIDNLIRHLILDQQYDSAQVNRREDNGKVVYSVRVGRIRKMVKLSFHGYDAISEADLRREFGLSEGMQFDQQSLYDASQRVREFYVSQGYALAKVDLEFRSQKESDGVSVDVRVSEGPQTTIREFEIVADNPELREKLKFALRGFRKEPINEKTMSELRSRIREFLSENRYFRAEIQDPLIAKTDDPSKSKLVYRFTNSDEYSLEFRGNITNSDRTIIKSLNLDQFTSSNPNVGAEIGHKIKNYYVANGYARAEVQVEESTSPKNKHVRILQFNIKEGPQVKIKSIDWVGRFSESPKTYTNFLKDHSSDAVSDGLYVKDDIDVGLKNLIIDRRNQGFLKAKIVSTRASNNPQKNEITLQINFDEGPLTQVRSIKFTGLQQLNEDDLRRQLDIEEGEPLKLNRLEDSIVKLKRFCQGKGFLEMAIVNERQDLVRYNDDNTLVDVVFQIFEGPQVRVGSIVIDGPTITKDYVVYKELEFRVGDILTPEKIEESVRRLQRIGHFSSVEIKTAEENTPNAIRTVLVKLTDRNPGLFLLGIGFSNERRLTFRGYTGLSYRNLGGMGRGVSARVDANYNIGDDNDRRYAERKFTLGYLEPYLFDTRMRGRVNLTQGFSIKPQDSTQGSELRQTTWTIEHDLTSHILISWDLFNLAKFRDFAVPSEKELTLLNIGSTSLTFDIDFRDHPFIPTRGTFTRINLEYGNPPLGSNATIEYSRAFASFTHYQSMGFLGLVWANSVRGGYLKNLSQLSSGSVPYDKRGFILGGESTVRGFTPGEGFPTIHDYRLAGVAESATEAIPGQFDTKNSRFNLNTDATMYLFKSELRFPLPWWKNVAAAIFYDGGSVAIGGLNFDRPYRDSFGIAARYLTPVGAVSAEYGWKVAPRGDRGEAAGVFNISVGTF